MTPRPLDGPDELERAARLLARAMHDDPMYRFIEPDDERRLGWLDKLMGDLLGMLVPEGHVYGCFDDDAGGDGELLAAIGLSPPGALPLPFGRRLRVAVRALLRRRKHRPGLLRLSRALGVLSRAEKAHPAEPHWYVWIAGVDPRAQGRGLGAALVRHACALADGEAPGHAAPGAAAGGATDASGGATANAPAADAPAADAPAALYLDTTNPRNVGFYQRYGFALRETLQDRARGERERAPDVLTMLRPSR